jgi:hypothetical protein
MEAADSSLNGSLYSKFLMILRQMMVTRCADRVLHALAAGSTYFAGRWICQQQSLYRQLSSVL